MVMKLEKVVPFGRSLDEYRHMFNLTDGDLNKPIIGVADGPASFNAEMSALGHSVISVDPLYIFNASDIENQFNRVVDNIIAQVKATPDDWVWTYHKSPDDLKQNRQNVMREFVQDYESGKHSGRYRVGELPELDFPNGQFQLALCSHFLFLYSEHYSREFHLSSVRELLRIAEEVRIFPLVTLMLDKSPYLQDVIDCFQAEGFEVSIEQVGYEIQKGGNEMIRIQASS